MLRLVNRRIAESAAGHADNIVRARRSSLAEPRPGDLPLLGRAEAADIPAN